MNLRLVKTALSVALWPALLLTACQKPALQYRQNSGEIFHTTYHITYEGGRDWQAQIDSCLQRFDASLSMFNPASTLSRINLAGTEPTDVRDDAWLCHLMDKAMEISALTGGAFDITVAPLVNLWGFGLSKSSDVTAAEVDSVRSFVGYEKLAWDGRCVTKADARMMLDASAIAKGYACDVVAQLLDSLGSRNYLVEIGGEIVLKGKNARQQVWTVGIDRPNDDPLALDRHLQTALQISDKAMATSGNYRNFYTRDGRKVAHTIDPSTGFPVIHSLLSATVLADDCLTADALATSFMVMGFERARSLSLQLPGIWCFFISSDEKGDFVTWCSPALEAYMRQI